MSTSPLLLTEDEIRAERAERIKRASDVRLPELRYWNYSPCAAHAHLEAPKVDCEYRACGGEFFDHQRVGVSWLYMRKRGLLADVPGAGKTNQILGLAALLKERGELTDRMLIVCQTPAVLQWLEEARRWVPKLKVDAAYTGLTKSQRVNKYVQDWDLMIIGYHMLLKDWKMLEKFEVGTVVTDDVDPLLNHDNQTHSRIVGLSAGADRSIVINATTIQTKLQQIHAATLPIGGFEVFGSLPSFERRYVRKEMFREMTRSGRIITKELTVGYKNGTELKSKLGPMVLRRTYDDLTDIRMPTIMPPQHVWLELHPEQQARYKELQDGVIRLKREEGETVKHAAALAKVTYGQQICSGLQALGEEDTPQGSIKLDWLMDKIDGGPFEDRKVVCFIKNIGLVKAFGQRLDKAGIGYGRVWGKETSAKHRQAEISRFWKDPKCRVFMGTASIERSLNLQVANIVVNVDTHLNPARMQQILGRVRRAGSRHDHVFVFNLFTRDTQEERYLDVLQKRQAVADYVWDDENQLYEALTPIEMLNLITP